MDEATLRARLFHPSRVSAPWPNPALLPKGQWSTGSLGTMAPETSSVLSPKEVEVSGNTPSRLGSWSLARLPESLLGVHLPLMPSPCTSYACTHHHASLADGHLLCDPDPKGTWRSCFGCKYGAALAHPPGLMPSVTSGPTAGTCHGAVLPLSVELVWLQEGCTPAHPGVPRQDGDGCWERAAGLRVPLVWGLAGLCSSS